MSVAPPTAILADRLQELLAGRQVRTALFLTFRFDPGFFEQEVLPTLFDRAFSHEPAVRLIQLEEELRDRIDHVAVYYDRAALEAGASSAKLDVRRIPTRIPTGYFHPKLVLLLVERLPDGDGGAPGQELVAGILSANLTRAGWWENVEVAHFETLRPGEKSSLSGDLVRFLRRVRSAAPAEADHSALDTVAKFLGRIDERLQKSSGGLLHPRLWFGDSAEYLGRATLVEFLTELLPRAERGSRLRLEVLSPYFDEHPEQGPLSELIEAFEPGEVRVALPVGPDGQPAISQAVLDGIRALPNVRWARLPKDLLQSGPSESAAPRRMHAKVYRFSTKRPRFEVLFVGSVNATTAGCSKGGNLELGILVQNDPSPAPDWWLLEPKNETLKGADRGEAEDAPAGPGVALALRYHWDRGVAEACWNAPEPSPRLQLDTQGAPLFELEGLPPASWIELDADSAAALGAVLASTSFVTVRIDGEDDAVILVQEEGMASKPSILLNLTVAEILRYWSELSESQREVLLTDKYARLVPALSALLPKAPLGALETRSIFESFAGIFHAFAVLDRDVRRAFGAGREKEAVYRLFGRKHDSLPHLLERLGNEECDVEPVERYLILLCAQQLVGELQREDPAGFATAHRTDFAALESNLERVAEARAALAPALGAEAAAFFDWYESWFRRRAEPAPEPAR